MASPPVVHQEHLIRYDNWPEKLNELIEARLNKPFKWGEHDCCLFAADAILAMTGTDLASDLRGTYASKTKAAKIVKEKGGLAQIATDRLGEPIPVLMAKRGDIVLMPVATGNCLAVCLGDKLAAPGPDALVFAPLNVAISAWKV
jgi:hypothetical protein